MTQENSLKKDHIEKTVATTPLALQGWEEYHAGHPDSPRSQYLHNRLSDIERMLTKPDELSLPTLSELDSEAAAKTLTVALANSTPIRLGEMSYVQATLDKPALLKEDSLVKYLTHTGEDIRIMLSEGDQVATINIQSLGNQLGKDLFDKLNALSADTQNDGVSYEPTDSIAHEKKSKLDSAINFLQEQKTKIAIIGLGILSLIAAGALAYQYINALPGNIRDIATATQLALNQPTLTHTLAPSELPPTLTPPPSPEPTLTYTATNTPFPKIEKTLEPIGTSGGEKPNFNQNIVDVDPSTHWQVGLSENTLLCLQENGDTFAKEINSVPIQIDSPIIGCAVMHEGQVRAINIDSASGNQLKVVVDGKGHIEVQIGTSTLTDLETFKHWGWVDRPGFEDTVRINSNILDWIKNYLQAQKNNLYVRKIPGQERSGKVVMGKLP